MSTLSPATWTEDQADVARSCLGRLLDSDTFEQASRMRRLVRFLTEHAIAGGGDSLNQYAIAIAVFDRDEDFDPTTDSIVRVEVGRLRAKLREYYEREGATEPIRIQIAKCGYTISFELRAALSASGGRDAIPAAETAEEPTVAVLPFVNLSSDPEQEYFSDGVTEDLITDLSRLDGLAVVARQSSFAYRGKAVAAPQISRELDADLIVEGSVRKMGPHIRFNVQLIEGASGQHLFAERFDYPSDEVFALQIDVNRRLLDALTPHLEIAHQAVTWRRPTDSVEAHDLLLRGIRAEEAGTPEALLRARHLFLQAAEVDPAYVGPHVRLSMNAQRMWLGGHGVDVDEQIAEASRHADRAVALDGEDASARAVRCWARLWLGEHDVALEDGWRAVENAPNNVVARERLAFVLAACRRGDEAMDHLQRARALNPLHAYHFPRGLCFYSLGRLEPAVEQFQRSVATFPYFAPSRMFLAATLQRLGRAAEARQTALDLRAFRPRYVPVAPGIFWRHPDDRSVTMEALAVAFDLSR